MNKLLNTTLAGALAFASASAFAQAASAAAPTVKTVPHAATAATTLPRADENFLKDATRGGLVEVQASQLAVTKAVSPDVKAFAQQMIDDHTRTQAEVNALAEAKGVQLPTEPTLMQKAKLKLKLLDSGDGPAFDRRYADGTGVSAHEDTVKLFKKAAASAQDADVKAFAAKTLPALQHHLEMARAIQKTARQEGNAKPGAAKG